MTNRRECVALTCVLVLFSYIVGSALPLRAQDTRSNLIHQIAWELSSGNIRPALADARRAVLEFPDSAVLMHLLAVSESENGLKEEARKSFHKAIRMDPTIPQNYYDLALLDMQTANYTAAISMIQTYLQISPENSKAHLMLGIAYRKQGKQQFAVAQLKKALASSPNLPLVHYNLGKIYQSQGKNVAALEQFRDELGINPKFYGVYWSAGDAEIAVKHYKAAEALFRRAIQLRPLGYQAYLGLARVFLIWNQLPNAESKLKMVINLDPENVEAHSMLASIYTQMGKPMDAKREELVVETLKSQAKQTADTAAKPQ